MNAELFMSYEDLTKITIASEKKSLTYPNASLEHAV